MPQSTLRANQRNALSLSADVSAPLGAFNGTVALTLFALAEESDLKFTANVTYQTSIAGNPSVTFSPCTDYGSLKEFNNIDDAIKWCNGAFYDITTLTAAVEGMASVNTNFVPPTDAVKDATSKKARFTKLKIGIDAKVAVMNAKVQGEILSGWHLPTANSVLQALHAETVKARDTVVTLQTFYAAEITRFNLIINPV